MRFDQPQQQLDMLSEFLSEQLNLYHHLLNLAKKEREVLSNSDIDGLNNIISEKTCLTQLLDKIENRRVKLMNDLAVKFNCPSENFTLKRLADGVDQTTAKRLLQLRKDLASVIERLQKENNINKRLMNHCIMLMDNSINILNSMLSHESTYIHTGYFNKADEGGFIFSGRI